EADGADLRRGAELFAVQAGGADVALGHAERLAVRRGREGGEALDRPAVVEIDGVGRPGGEIGRRVEPHPQHRFLERAAVRPDLDVDGLLEDRGGWRRQGGREQRGGGREREGEAIQHLPAPSRWRSYRCERAAGCSGNRGGLIRGFRGGGKATPASVPSRGILLDSRLYDNILLVSRGSLLFPPFAIATSGFSVESEEIAATRWNWKVLKGVHLGVTTWFFTEAHGSRLRVPPGWRDWREGGRDRTKGER